MTFIIDRYYTDNREQKCQVLKNRTYQIEEILDIIGLIIMLYKEYRPYPRKCEIREIKEILSKFFNCKDVKHKYERELPFVSARLSCKVLFQAYDMSGKLLLWIDVDEVEERYRGRNLALLMQKYLTDEMRQFIIKNIERGE